MNANPYASNELFHFVGRQHPNDHERNYSILSSILTENEIVHSLSDRESHFKITVNSDGSLLDEDFLVPTVTCYCDIPFECLSIHLQKYGQFGLAFSRQLLIRLGARPVYYFPLEDTDFRGINGRELVNDIEQVYRGFSEHVKGLKKQEENGRSIGVKPSTYDKAVHAMDSILKKDILAFIKPFNSELSADNPDNYYMEREWRKIGPLSFKIADVNRVIVNHNFSQRFNKDFPQYKDKVHCIASEEV